MKKTEKVRIWFSRIAFVIGLIVLAFPFVSQFFYYQASHTEISSYTKEVAKLNDSEIQHRMDLAAAYNAALFDTNKGQLTVSDPYSSEEKAAGVAEYARMLEVHEQIGNVTIPKINQEIPIYAGTAEHVLQKGVGHLEGTSLPIGGENTHAVLSAHRGLPTARLFTDLDKLAVGDRFYVQNVKEKLAYQVEEIKVIEPTDLEQLSIVPHKDYVTLLTCTPYMINSHRLLVRGVRIPYDSQIEKTDKEYFTGKQQQMYIVYTLIGVVLVIGFFLIKRLWKRRKNK